LEEFEKELKLGFLDEAEQAVSDTEQCFLALETNPEDEENLNKIFRLAHNLKGSSKAVGFDEFGAFTHEFESFILKVKNGELKTTPQVINLLLRANDHIGLFISELKSNLDARLDSKTLIHELTYFSETSEEVSTEVSEEASEEVSVESSEENSNIENESSDEEKLIVEELISSEDLNSNDESVAVVALDAVMSNVTPILKVLPEIQESPPVSNVLPTKSNSKPASQGATDESIRVALSKVELLINFVGEMVILQSVMKEQVHQINSELLKKTVLQLGKVGKEIQDLSMSLRMMPVKPTFQKMIRIVRDTAQQLNKDVTLHLEGEETELDKTVLEKINDPLVHLIRNSVDHGIESSDVRVSRGKSAKGNVTLRAFHQSGKLVLEVKDDGGGIDPNYLKKKAIEKGILSSTANLTDREALNLIFAPGFSTKEKVTDVSGRGVGMDVVRSNIQELSGEIQMESELEKGSLFRITLPLTLAIVEAMVVTYSREKFVIPLNHVYETLKPNPNMIETKSGLGDVLMLRGENMPLVRLGDFFGIKNNTPQHEMIAMVIKSGKQPFAILVDDILGQYQVVIKQLGRDLSDIKGVSGSTILGDGRPALIIEPQDLLKRKITNNYSPVQPVKGDIKIGGIAS